MNILVVLPDLFCKVKYFIAVVLDLVVEDLIGVLRILSEIVALPTRFHDCHNLAKLLSISETGRRAVYLHLLF